MGARSWTIAIATVVAIGAAGMSAVAPRASAANPLAGWVADTTGRVAAVGGAPRGGDLGGVRLNQPVIAIAGQPASTTAYWMAAFDGGVFAFGGARFYGSMGAYRLNQPVVGIASTPSGHGYWLVAADGGIFGFGDARFYGSMAAYRLNQRVVAMAVTKTGHGYWLVAADGGIFGFGDAHFYGSTGAIKIASPMSTMAVTPSGLGYWLMDRTGRVRGFGDAAVPGSASITNAIADALVPSSTGAGYWIGASDGSIRAFGDASAASAPAHLPGPVVGLATPNGSSSGFGLPLLEFLEALAQLQAPVRTSVGPHEVALTFDDGPAANTAAMVATLHAYGVTATFFTVGYEAAARPDLLQLEAANGEHVEAHSWDHPDLTRLTPAAIASELQRSIDAVTAAGLPRPRCFRPPYGSTNSTVAQVGASLGLTQILWNVDPSDYLRPGTSTIVNRVLSQANGRGLLIGMHDGGGDRSQTVAALPAIITGLWARGYTFVRLC